MADVSLDEVIRQRGINLKAPAKRPMFGRGAGAVGKSFDARQKIGANDVRQRLGPGAGFQVKDAREKLVQKDARFKIRGRGGGGGGGGGAGCSADDQLTQTGAKSVRCPCTDNAKDGSNTTSAGPDICATDADTKQL
ncbi:hypothetical protein OYC64_006541 [Pagothenia borchgrevinki]|uniref:Uncharacterized protein n=1 Tax=Pagothenia borchgrevinki TaxID=8213 RepID=A0ABD2GLI0_PAGBO